jgi:rare lipoprotein A
MRCVAGVFPRQVQPATWAAALGVAVFWVAAALYVAHHITSVPSSEFPPAASVATEPTQTPNRAAKAAREPMRKEARRAPGLYPPVVEVALPVPEIVMPLPEDGGNEDAPAETGRASWYELDSKTASGEDMDPEGLSAAHPSLPFGTKVKVDNLGNGHSVVVRINDRGPFAKGRIIDVSKAAAKQLGMVEAGVANVSISPLTELVSAEAETPPLSR